MMRIDNFNSWDEGSYESFEYAPADYQVAITATTVRIKRIINAPGILKLKRFFFLLSLIACSNGFISFDS